jgi:hypothetical protein
MTEMKPIIWRQGKWLYRVSYHEARRRGVPQNFDSKTAFIGICLQLAVADELGYHTKIPMGVPDNGVDIQSGSFIVDIKGRWMMDGSYRLWNQNFEKKLNPDRYNILVFAEGNSREYSMLGWMNLEDVIKIPILKHGQYAYRTVPLKMMKPIQELMNEMYGEESAKKLLLALAELYNSHGDGSNA